MTLRSIALLFVSLFVASCVVVVHERPPFDRPDEPDRPRGIAGEWDVKRDGSILSCTLIVERGSRRGEGTARDRGCIAYDGLGFVRRWERNDGRIDFYTIGDERVLTVRRSGPNEFRGRLLRSDNRVTLTRK